MKLSDLTGRPIVSLSGGVKIGEVADLTLDATRIQVSAVVLRGHDGSSVVPYSAVRHVGPDAVTIDDSRMVQSPGHDGGGADRRVSTLTGLAVLNQQGVVIGSVDDLEIDEESGRVTALLIHRGGVMGIGGSHEEIAVAAIRGIGPQMVTVDLTLRTVLPVGGS